MKVLYTGALYDSSGYAEAARNYLAALATQPDIQLSARVVSFETWKTDLSEVVTSLIEKAVATKMTLPDVQIIHLTPENFPRYRIPGCKNIGYTVWETSKLPDSWVPLCNMMDEIWVPCDWNVDVFRSSGVTVPVKKIPHTLNLHEEPITDGRLEAIPTGVFNFYSIFQWSSRKNPEGLLAAYLSEFRSSDKVNLVLKTYLNNNTEADKRMTIDAINRVKQDLQLQDKGTPGITLVHGGLSKFCMVYLHKTCDCFVLPHRAEGWGVPHFEAMMYDKPVITTGFGGNLEFMNADTSYLLSFEMTPVKGMGRPTYNGWMDWAEPSISNLRYWMRHVYEHQEEIQEKVKAGREKIRQFDWREVGKLMKESM
jgi:glycosyltransferase involved in cell wall biosynthesis